MKTLIAAVSGIAAMVLTSLPAQNGGFVRSAAAQQTAAGSQDGVVHVPAFDLPLPDSLSKEGHDYLIGLKKLAIPAAPVAKDGVDPAEAVANFRRQLDAAMLRPWAESQMAKYPVTVTKSEIAGVPVAVVVPVDGIAASNRKRVLINLHGGGFIAGAGWGGLVESVPLAGLGKFRVVTVEYREAPENRYPAGTEDVVKVYNELRKTYKPGSIGIYGCSAGGALTAQVTAWIVNGNLPKPGAIGILGSGLPGSPRGDSAITATPLSGITIASMAGRADHSGASIPGYFDGTDPTDPRAYPGRAPASLLGRFPPTILITGTRAPDLSAVIVAHRALVNAGATAELNVWDAMPHCFLYDPSTPEATDAYRTLIRFFDRHLGSATPAPSVADRPR